MTPRPGSSGRDRGAGPGPAPDTIVAEATARGVGGVALVRISGPDARAVLARLLRGGTEGHPGEPESAAREDRARADGFGDGGSHPGAGGSAGGADPENASPGEGPAIPPPRRPTLRALHDPATGDLLDRGLVTLFPGPESYTGEDVVELSVHGGWLVPPLVVEACRAAGARPAEPGEFTRRAYLNGKLDLVQAEAVADLVEGRSRALHRAAVHQLERGLSGRIAGLREKLVGVEALLVHHLDFPDEDEPPVSRDEVAAEADGVAEALESLLATAPEGELLREGALTVLAGRPNTGKSSLFNALLGRERAIVTDTPGTTRDALEATVSLGGFPFRLVDTAGLRETTGEVEGKGIEVARRYLAGADLVLLCAEAGRPLGGDERSFVEGCRAPVVVLRTRADEADGSSSSTRPPPPPGWEGGPGGAMAGRDGSDPSKSDRPSGKGPEAAGRVQVSVVTGEGLSRVRDLLPSLVYRGLVEAGGSAPVLTRERHARGVRAALEEVRLFSAALRSGVPAEVASAHLRPAESALEEVLGVVDREEILDAVFARFCIGK